MSPFDAARSTWIGDQEVPAGAAVSKAHAVGTVAALLSARAEQSATYRECHRQTDLDNLRTLAAELGYELSPVGIISKFAKLADWRDAVEDACAHIWTQFDEKDPRKTLARLIAESIAMDKELTQANAVWEKWRQQAYALARQPRTPDARFGTEAALT